MGHLLFQMIFLFPLDTLIKKEGFDGTKESK